MCGRVTLLGAALATPVMPQAYQRGYRRARNHKEGATPAVVSIVVHDTLDVPVRKQRH